MSYDADEFHALVRRINDHWIWTGPTEGGLCRPTWRSLGGRPQPRQFAYWLSRGEVPVLEDGYVMPSCGFLLCVQPDHIAVVDRRTRRSIIARSTTSAGPQPTSSQDALIDDSLLSIALAEHTSIAAVVADWPDTCVYCGAFATDMDHLLPRSWTGDSIRQLVPTVPSCGDCNGALSDTVEPRISERALIAAQRLRQRWAREVDARPWSRDELEDLTGSLRKHVQKKQRHGARLRERIRVLEMGGLAKSVAEGGVPLAFRDVADGLATSRSAEGR